MPLDVASPPAPDDPEGFERFVINMAHTGIMLPRADLLALIAGLAHATGWHRVVVHRPPEPRFNPFGWRT